MNASANEILRYRPSLWQNLVRWLYSGLLVLLIPFVFLLLVKRGVVRAKDYNQRRFERFGFVAKPKAAGGYLFHCVSVGEVVTASCLIKEIMRREPDVAITITTTTPTGSARVRSIFGDSVHHFYLPYDLHMAMAGMLRRVKPKCVMITEVELWPNLIHACWRRAIPVMVINARMTDRSAKRYKKFPALFQPMLKKLTFIGAQGQRDFDNYQWLGAPSEVLVLTQNIKFDQVGLGNNDPTTEFCGLVKGLRPVIVGGSTHEGEEVALLNAVAELEHSYPNLLLVIVPRHPERFSKVAELLHERGVNWVSSKTNIDVAAEHEVLLVDEMGRLNQAYTVADVAFVGGSLADKGGHNALEPAACKVPVIMGPNTYNNPAICEQLEQVGALAVVHSQHELVNQLKQWFDSDSARHTAGDSGHQVLLDNQGAVATTLAEVTARIAAAG